MLASACVPVPVCMYAVAGLCPAEAFLEDIANATLLGPGALLAFLTSPFGLVGFPLAVLCIVHALGPSAGMYLGMGLCHLVCKSTIRRRGLLLPS